MKLIVILFSILSIKGCCNSPKTVAVSQSESVPQLELNGPYTIISIFNEDVAIYNLEVDFNAAEKRITGFSGCNRFFGNYTLSDSTITFGPQGSTKMYCDDDANTIETKLYEAFLKINRLNFNHSSLEFMSGNSQVLKMIKKPQEMISFFEYSTVSRGTYKLITINKKQISIISKRDATPIIKRCSELEWGKLIDAVKTLNIENISNLKAPSEKRLFDGALIANLTIQYNGETYESASFDHGNPPAEIERIVKEILSISENIE